MRAKCLCTVAAGWLILLAGTTHAQQQIVDFEGLAEGMIVNEVFSNPDGFEVVVSGVNPNLGLANAAMIFDSDCSPGGSDDPPGTPADCTGGDGSPDWDLGTPNEAFGGPGRGAAGAAGPFVNSVRRGNLLIVSEDLDQSDPDDADVEGAMLLFDFTDIGSVEVRRLDLLDVEAVEPAATVEFINASDVVFKTVPLPQTGDNGFFRASNASLPGFLTRGVVKMKVTLNGSGAIDGLVFFPEVFCGNSRIDPGETCDPPGSLIDDIFDPDRVCRDDCTYCGDRITNDGEECDDGNDVNDDSCRNDCTIPICGDGIVDPQNGETCDPPGDPAGGNGNLCRDNCTVCGDGLVNDGEQCDDGNGIDGDGCDNDCTPSPFCGDGVLDPGEECDDGNNDDGDGCSADCLVECTLALDKTCLPAAPLPSLDVCADSKPNALVFVYTGESCDATDHDQDPSKVSCSGDPAGAQPIQVVMTKDADKISVDPIGESINVGDSFEISRDDGNNFASDTMFDIRQGSTTLQSIKFHTSCSQPLNLGDQFGSNLLIGATLENGDVLALPAPPEPSDDCEISSPPPPHCEGKVRSITFRYLGGTCADTTNDQEGKVECSGEEFDDGVALVMTKDPDKFLVEPASGLGIGDLVTVIKFENGEVKDLPADIELDIGDQSLKLHTSCSKPLNLGDRFGALEVVTLETTENGIQAIGAEVEYAYEVTNIGMSDVVNISVEDNVLGSIGSIGSLNAGESQTLTATVFVDADVTNTGTASGMTAGGAFVCEASDTVEVMIVEPPLPPGSCDDGKPTELIFVYTGEDCSATSHDQDTGKVDCTGDPAFAEPVSLVMTKDADKFIVTPSGESINVGDTVSIKRPKVTDNFPSEVMLDIRQGGSTLQSLRFHTSCSQPLAEGDQFGALLLDTFVPEQ